MRRISLLLLSTAVAAGAFTFAASADRGPGLFEQADTDKDGFVSKQEFAASRDIMFGDIDLNKDGNLTQDELDKAHEAWRARMQKPAQDQSAEAPQKPRHDKGGFMKRIDANADGTISAAEFNAAGERMFARLDDNGDGKIAKDEVPHRRHHKPEQQPAQ